MSEAYGRNFLRGITAGGKLVRVFGYGPGADIEYTEPEQPRRGTPLRHLSNAQVDAKYASYAQSPPNIDNGQHDAEKAEQALRKAGINYW